MTKRFASALVFFAALVATPAVAQQVRGTSPTPNTLGQVSNWTLNSATLTDATTFSGSLGSLVIDMNNAGSGNAGGSNAGPILYNLATDYSTWPAGSERSIFYGETLSLASNTTNIWEGYSVFLTLNGP